MANPMRMLISSFLLILAFYSFSTVADTSTIITSSKDQVPCQMCISCDNPCPVNHPPPPPPLPPVVLCPPPPSPPPPPKVPECPPPPPSCPECPPCNECKPGPTPIPAGPPKPDPRNPQTGVISGTVYGPPSAAGGALPYFPSYNMNPPAAYATTATTSASTSIQRKLWNSCSTIISLLLVPVCFF